MAVFHPSKALEAAQAFLKTEASGGLVLLMAAVTALFWANSPWADSYADLWNTEFKADFGLVSFEEDLRHVLNDGLMTLFFFLVGLEIKRELVAGELSEPRQALLPAVAAIGGMVVPAAIYLALNPASPEARGWGISMATDIAFAVSVLSLAGDKIPLGLKIFLLALAIVDDIGAVLVIAVFYTESIEFEFLVGAAFVLGIVALAQRAGVRNMAAYWVLGLLVWMAFFKSGVHPTMAGVALALLTPWRPSYDPNSASEKLEDVLNHHRFLSARGDAVGQDELHQADDPVHGGQAPLERLERGLHPWVSFLILPAFALANAGLNVDLEAIRNGVGSPVSQGVSAGLLLGKPVGILALSWIAVRLKIAELPADVRWSHVVAVGLIAGIGFTVSLFITDLAFGDPALQARAKLGILASSLLAGVGGYLLLNRLSAPARRDAEFTFHS